MNFKELEEFTKDAESYQAWNGKTCYRTFGNLDYYFLLCTKWGLTPKVKTSGLVYEAKNKELELDYCENDIILHIKKIYIKSLFSGWHEASLEQAKAWATHRITNANCKEKAIENTINRLLGATINQLI